MNAPIDVDPIPIDRSSTTVQPGDMTPQPGDMEPTAFVCKGCSKRIQEKKYGAGFQNCGAVMADKKYMLCPRCLSIVMELLEALQDSLKLGRFASDLMVESGGK